VSVADLAPAGAEASKRTLTLQVAPGASGWPRQEPSTTVKPAPAAAEIVPLGRPPPFDTVKAIGADELPMVTPPKSWLVGATARAALGVKVAVTVFDGASSATAQSPAPGQPGSDQAVKVKPGSATAPSVTDGTLKVAWQVGPQLIVGVGFDVTVP